MRAKYDEKDMSKISIRFYKDHKVRAVWDNEVSDRQAEEGSEVVSDTTQLKLKADGRFFSVNG